MGHKPELYQKFILKRRIWTTRKPKNQSVNHYNTLSDVQSVIAQKIWEMLGLSSSFSQGLPPPPPSSPGLPSSQIGK